MKKKLIPLMLASSLALGATFTLASCAGKNAAEEMLKSLIIQNDGQTISKDFKVAASLKKGENTYNLLWSSDSEYLKVAEEAKDNYYNITVTRPEDNAATVKLTAELDVDGAKSTKDFTFHVSPLDVNDFIEGFKFAQKGALVDSDFDLPQSFTIGSKTAQISWVSNTPDLITISSDGKTANVLGAAPKETAQLKATFSYKNVTGSDVYSVIVTRKSTAFEKLRNWYKDTGVAQELKGYVVAKDVYSEQYGNTSVYISDENAEGGYYGYRVKVDQATYDKLTFGTLISISSQVNTEFNALWETTAGATVTVFENEPKKTRAELVRNIDEDLIANTTDLFYKSSSLVKLNGWKIKDLNATNAKDATKYEKGNTILTLTKKVGTTDIDINVVANAYTVLEDTAKTALANTCKGLAVGDIVDISGVLGYNNKDKVKFVRASYQINVIDAQSIVKSAVQTESTYADAPVVAKAISEISAKIPAKVYENTTLNLDQMTTDGVSITWDFSTPADLYVPKTATFNDGKTQLNIRPVDKKDEVVLVAKFTKGSYTVEQYYDIETISKSPEQMVNETLINYRKTDKLKINLPGTYDLLTLDKEYKKVTYTYEILEQKDSNGNTDNIANVVVNGDKTQLVIGPVDRDDTHTIKYRVTLTCPDGENQPQTASAEFTLTITNEKIVNATAASTPESGKSYKFGVYQNTLGDFYFFTGKADGNYLATSTNPADAVNVTVTAKENGKYTLSFKDADNNTKYLALKDTAASNATGGVNAVISDTEFEFSWNATYHTFSAMIAKDAGAKEFYIGSYSKNKTLSSSAISYAATSFTSAIYTSAVEMNSTRQEKADFEKGQYAVTAQLAGDTYTIPTASLFKDVDVTAAIKDDEFKNNATVSQDGKKITFAKLDADSKVNVTFTFNCGGKVATKDLEIAISTTTLTPAQFVAGVTDKSIKLNDRVSVTALVTKVANNQLTVSDGINTFAVYGKINNQNYSADLLGKVIKVNGTYSVYNDNNQLTNPVILSETSNDQAIIDYVMNTIESKTFSGVTTFDLPATSEAFQNVTITWELVSGGTFGEGDDVQTVIALTGNTLTFTPVLEDVNAIVRATITLQGHDSVTKDITITVSKRATQEIALTATDLELAGYATVEGKEVKGLTLAFNDIMKCTQNPNVGSIQFKKPSGTAPNQTFSTIKNTVATEVDLYKFVITSLSDLTANKFRITVSKTADFAEAVELTGVLTPGNSKEVTYTAEAGYTFFKIECATGTGYLDSITIVLR